MKLFQHNYIGLSVAQLDHSGILLSSVFSVTALLCMFLIFFADGYISLMNVELNIKEMLELGKKAQAAGRGGNLELDTISISSRCWLTPR